MFTVTFKWKPWYIGMTSLQLLDGMSILVLIVLILMLIEANITFQALLRGRRHKVLQSAVKD